MTSTPEADARLIAAHDLAIAALHEITPAHTVGKPAGYMVEPDGSVSLRFENRMSGYPGWFWTVTVDRVEDAEPTVLEVELLPGDGALLAPEWVPWAERLADYRAHQIELAAEAAATADAADSGDDDELDEDDDDDLDDDDDDLDDDDDDDDDEDDDDHPAPVLHSGDLDGVDIDELDDSSVIGEDDDDFVDSDEDSDSDGQGDEEE